MVSRQHGTCYELQGDVLTEMSGHIPGIQKDDHEYAREDVSANDASE